MYPLLFRGLKKLPPEFAHELAFAGLRALEHAPIAQRLLAQITHSRDPRLAIERFGVRFSNPIGLAAGFDKDGRAPNALGALGFGFVETGTVTAHAQPGNPKPRLFRLVDDRAIVNRMGFNNAGARALASRLARAPRASTTSLTIGVNIGKTKACAIEDAANDYATSAEALAPYAAYCAVNVSSPNTPGLRSLQSVESLREILAATREALDRGAGPTEDVPLLVKIAPDLADDDVLAIADLALEMSLDGVIATNTTIARSGLRSGAREVEACGAGGLSGPPVAQRSLEVLDLLYARVGGRLTIISVGGIASIEDAWTRIVRGASLIQLYTSFIYEGPSIAARLARGLSQKLDEHGFRSLDEAIGARARR